MSLNKDNSVNRKDNENHNYDHRHNAFGRSPVSLEPGEIPSDYVHGMSEQFVNREDDFDRQFMDHLYKERDSSEGWDKYYEMFCDELQNDDGRDAHSTNLYQNGSTSSGSKLYQTSSEDGAVGSTHLNKPFSTRSFNVGLDDVSPNGNNSCQLSQEKRTSFNNIDSLNFSIGGTVHSINFEKSKQGEKHEESKMEEKQKDAHYFQNGRCYFGSRAEPVESADEQNQRKAGSSLNLIDRELYKKLINYHSMAKEKSKEKLSSQAKTSECFTGRDGLKTTPFPSQVHRKQNGVSSKEPQDPGHLGLHSINPLDSTQFENSRQPGLMCADFTRKQPKTMSKEKEGIRSFSSNDPQRNKSDEEKSKKKLFNKHGKFGDVSTPDNFPRNESNGRQNEGKENVSMKNKESLVTNTAKVIPQENFEENKFSKKQPTSSCENVRKENLHSFEKTDKKSHRKNTTSKVNATSFASDPSEKSMEKEDNTASKTNTATTKKSDSHFASISSKLEGGKENNCLPNDVGNKTHETKRPTNTSHTNIGEDSPNSVSQTYPSKSKFTHDKERLNSGLNEESKSSTPQSKKESSCVNAKVKPHKEKTLRNPSCENDECERLKEEISRRSKKAPKIPEHVEQHPYKSSSSSAHKEKTPRSPSFEKDEPNAERVKEETRRRSKKTQKIPEHVEQHPYKSSSTSAHKEKTSRSPSFEKDELNAESVNEETSKRSKKAQRIPEHVEQQPNNSSSTSAHKEKTPRSPSFEKDESNAESMNEETSRRSKKAHKMPKDFAQPSQKSSSTSRLQKDRKVKHKRSESSEKHFEKEKITRKSTEDKIGKVSANESLKSLVWRVLYAAKDIGLNCLFGLFWLLSYIFLVKLILWLCLCTFAKCIVMNICGYVMTWRPIITIIDKLWLYKVYIIRWYATLKEFIKEKISGPKREAQTYNLPDSGEDAVQQLLVRQGPDNNPYRILGVPKEATDDDIRKQYRKFAVLVHPDKNKHPHSAKAFQILTSAYDVLGDTEKRNEYDRELARREKKDDSNLMKNPADYTNPHDFFVDFMKQMEEMRETMYCKACQGRHRRIPTTRPVVEARFCSDCCIRHQAREGDFWKESRYFGIGNGKFYTRADNVIYDITEWGLCQERCGFHLPSDSHRVIGKISAQPPPRQRYTEEDFLRDLFGQANGFDGGHHGNRDNQTKQKQRPRRRKRK